MSTVTDMLLRDVVVMFRDMGDTHTLGAVSLTGVIAPLTIDPRAADAWKGTPGATVNLYCLLSDLVTTPPIGSRTTLDTEPVVVRNTVQTGGMLGITLEYVPPTVCTDTATVIHYAAADGWTAPAETSREADLDCRFLRATQTVTADNGEAVEVQASVTFDADHRPATLSLADRIIVDAVSWLIVKITEERDFSGAIIAQTVYLVSLGEFDEYGSAE